MTRLLYLAGPITGITYSDAADWRADLDWKLARFDNWRGLSPMRGKEHLRGVYAGALPSNFDGDREAVARDLYDIDRCDAVLVNLAGAQQVSIGTMCELGYAFARGKYILVVTGVGAEYAAHDHLFVRSMASNMVATLEDALEVIAWL